MAADPSAAARYTSGPDPLPEPLVPFKVTTHNLTVGEFTRDETASYDYDLDAPYQRGSVWDIERRRELIKSFISGIPIGAVTISNTDRVDRPYRVVDGKQRIETLKQFVAGVFDVPGHWFPERDLEDGEHARAGMVRHSDLTVPAQRRFSNRPVPAQRFNATTVTTGNQTDGLHHHPQTDAQVLEAERRLYLAINAGGVDHTDEDLDRARPES